jgi:hypothetical protein
MIQLGESFALTLFPQQPALRKRGYSVVLLRFVQLEQRGTVRTDRPRDSHLKLHYRN